MSFKSDLRIGKTLLPASQCFGIGYFGEFLAVDSALGLFVIAGEGLSNCVIDLLNGLCRDVQTVSEGALMPTHWQARSVTLAKRIPAGSVVTHPFEVLTPNGWLSFEMKNGWHFWPVKALVAIIQTSVALLFIYDTVTFEVQAKTPTLTEEFDRWAKRSYVARHFTERDRLDYMDLIPVERFSAIDIRLRYCTPQQAVKGKCIRQYLLLRSDGLKIPNHKIRDRQR